MSAPPGSQAAPTAPRPRCAPARVVVLALALAFAGGCKRGGADDPSGAAGGGQEQGAKPAGATAEGPEGGGGAAGGEQGGGAPAAGGPPGSGGQRPEVTVITLEPQDVQITRELPGRVSPFLVAEVRPQVNGIVEKRFFTEGGKVKAGQVLYQLEDETYLANERSAQANVARARAALKVAQQNAKRSEMLFEGDAISAQANDTTVAQLGLARADLQSAQAALESARVTLGYARIRAPISGRVGKSSVTEGALVTASQQNPLVTVQQLDPVYVDVTQSSSELLALRKAIKEGQLGQDEEAPVTILLEDGTRYGYAGRLRFADVTVDPSTGSFLVRIEVRNPEDVLLPGMYVRAVLGRGVRKDGLLVPQQGITRDPTGQATAMVVGEDGKVAVRKLETNQTVGSSWLVESGLAAGDRVIVQGTQKVQPGMQVEAVEVTEPESATGGAGPSDGGVPLPPGK